MDLNLNDSYPKVEFRTEIGAIYQGDSSILMLDIIENERVHVYNISNGERFETYAIKGEKGSGVIGVNGAAAHKAEVNDLVIIVSYATMEFEEAKIFTPQIIIPDNNKLP